MFQPITDVSKLPPIGAIETDSLDFKGRGEHEGKLDAVEFAKDVAALANSIGGSLIYGACEAGNRLSKYKPLEPKYAGGLRRAISEAVTTRCSPTPVFTPREFDLEGGKLVVVDVWPFPGQAVGVRGEGERDGYFFPMRSGANTNFLKPEQLPMLMIPELRRVVILLRSIPERDKILVREPRTDPNWGYSRRYYSEEILRMVSIDELLNRVIFERDEGHQQVSVPIPLDRVTSVFRDMKGWVVTLDE